MRGTAADVTVSILSGEPPSDGCARPLAAEQGVLGLLPEEVRGPPPNQAGGWEAALAALPEELQGEFDLKYAGPPEELIKALCLLLPTPAEGGSVAVAGGAVRAVAVACAQLEAALLCGLESEEVLRREIGELTDRAAMLLNVRLSRLRLVRELRGRMESLAADFEAAVAEGWTDGGGASERLANMQAEARRGLTDCYPELDKVPIEELTAWADRAWDWETGAYVR